MADMGEIVRGEEEQYLRTHRAIQEQRKALAFMGRCRTASMGLLEAVECESCGVEYPVYRSCRNRNCPGCQAEARTAWLEAREQELLDVGYFHVVFTLPEELNIIALWCPEVFYAALLRAAGKALLEVGLSKLDAHLGVLAILHTWGQLLWLHPHAHCVVPGGGFSIDGKRWISVPNPEYLLPCKYSLGAVARFCAGVSVAQHAVVSCGGFLLRSRPSKLSPRPRQRSGLSTRRLRSAGRSRCSSIYRNTRTGWPSATAGSWRTKTTR